MVFRLLRNDKWWYVLVSYLKGQLLGKVIDYFEFIAACVLHEAGFNAAQKKGSYDPFLKLNISLYHGNLTSSCP